MGTLSNGIFGPVRGKVGKLVSYQLLGKEVVRVVGENTKPPSMAQLENRQRLKVLALVQKPIMAFLKIGFRYEAALVNKYPANIASMYNYREALGGSYPDIGFDFTAMRVAQGSLALPLNPAVAPGESGLDFTWDTGDWMELEERRHRAMVMAYFPELRRATFVFDGASRYEGSMFLPLAGDLTGEYMETYLAFTDLVSGKASNSVYTGSFNGI